MLLFMLSFLMVTISSYLLASCFEIKKYATGFIYFFLIAFAQVVLNIELLSLIKSISIPGVLILNTLFTSAIVWFWNLKQRPLYKPQIKEFMIKALKSMRKDKTLFVLGIAFVFFIAVTIFICAVAPVISFDALVYHINRCAFWIFQKSLNHFEIADARNLVMPINSEILYTWNILFFKKDMGVGFFSFCGYLLSIVSLYGFLELLGFSNRKRLWSVFMLSSIASVVIQASGTETDIIIGGLALSGIFLFLLATKKNSIPAIYFSSLAFALAIGTKTSAFFTLPACALIMAFFLYKHNKENFLKYAKIFLGFAVLNFIIFSSYNYILNLIHYHHPMGNKYLLLGHSSLHNLKAYFASFIRHIVLMFDFTGFIYSDLVQKNIIEFQNKILNAFHIPPDYNIIIDNHSKLNRTLIDPFVGGGVIGLIVFMPATLIAVFKIFCKKASEKIQTLALLGASFYLCIISMSMIIGFMVFNVRFLTTFIILSSPIFVYSYIKSNKNILKYIILFYSLSYMILISTNIWARDFYDMINTLKTTPNYSTFREKIICATHEGYVGKMPFCLLKDKIQTLPKDSAIGLISSENDRVYPIKLLEYEGYKIDTLVIEKFEDYNIKKYDYIISTKEYPETTSFEKFQQKKKAYWIKNKRLFFDNKINPNMCIYSGKNNVLIVQTKEISPILSVCTMPIEQLSENNFRLIGYIKTQSKSEQDVQQFYFYKKQGN
jgi:hypothetical protein